jgi:hypothetical protein
MDQHQIKGAVLKLFSGVRSAVRSAKKKITASFCSLRLLDFKILPLIRRDGEPLFWVGSSAPSWMGTVIPE